MPHCDEALTNLRERAIDMFGMGRSFEHLLQRAVPSSKFRVSAKIVGVCQQASPVCLKVPPKRHPGHGTRLQREWLHAVGMGH